MAELESRNGDREKLFASSSFCKACRPVLGGSGVDFMSSSVVRRTICRRPLGLYHDELTGDAGPHVCRENLYSGVNLNRV
jgi:hypothetical protein